MTIQLGEHGRFLGSRLKAKEIRDAVEVALGHGERVSLDFLGVESITDSFADELLGVVCERHGGRLPTTVDVINAKRGIQDTIDFAVDQIAPA